MLIQPPTIRGNVMPGTSEVPFVIAPFIIVSVEFNTMSNDYEHAHVFARWNLA